MPYYNQYNGYTPYYPNIQRPQDIYQPMQYNRVTNLQGKIVDNIEVVKAIDIPLDGSTSYFPMADGTAIVSKQLQQDGTSKIIIYRPVEPEAKEEQKYITQNDLKAQFGDLSVKDIKDIKDEIKSLKKQIRDVTEDLEDKKGD